MAFNEKGLVPLRFNEIEEIIQAKQIATLPQKISYDNSNTIHQLNSVYARTLDQVSELVEAAFDQRSLNSAVGTNLDEIGYLRGVYRLQASPSNTSKQVALLQQGAVLQAGSLFYAPNLGLSAISTAPVSGTLDGCVEVKVIIPATIVVGATYGWSINGTNYNHVAVSGNTLTTVVAGIKADLDADTNKTFTYIDEALGSERRFTFTANANTTINISSLTIEQRVSSIKKYFYVELVDKGSKGVPAGEMTILQTPTFGVLGTTNEEAFLLGREQETDVEFRGRIAVGPISDSTGTPDTIRQSLLTNVQGVTYVQVIENLYDMPVDADGRPWLTYETLVLGGSDADVAQDIWRTKPADGATWGNIVNYPVEDSTGTTQFVNFSRPSPVTINVVVEHDRSLSEAVFPAGGATAMQTAIINYITSLPIGQNVVANRLIGVAYAAIGGRGTIITSIEIEDAANPGLTDFISIAATEYSVATVSSVTITDVTP